MGRHGGHDRHRRWYRRAKLQLVTAPFSDMCRDAGIVRTAMATRDAPMTRPIAHCDIGGQKNANVLSFAREGALIESNKGSHTVGLKTDSGPLQ